MFYSQKRYITYTLITIFTIIIPFVKIDGNHLLLLSFDKMEFHFLGFLYNMNELYVMPFLLMFLFIGIFAITSVFGRVWCGWACPQTIFRVIYRDLIETKLLNLRRIKNKQKDIDYSKKLNSIKKYIAIFIWFIISTIISINFMLYFIPPEDFFLYIQEPSEHFFLYMFLISIITFLVFDIVLMKEDFCTYACPYSRIQSVLYDGNTKQVVYDTNRGGNIYVNSKKSILNINQWSSNEECTTCEACVKVCPTHIDIRKGLQVECINCLECSDACETVMGKLGKKSLINWASTNLVLNKTKTLFFSKKNSVYLLSLCITLLLAGFFASNKEYLLVNINRTTNLYNIKENSQVLNNYLITIHNTQKNTYSYDIKIDNPNFEIKRFRKVILEPKSKIKTVLIIGTKDSYSFLSKQKNSIKLEITVFAKENKEIKIKKEIHFFYPN